MVYHACVGGCHRKTPALPSQVYSTNLAQVVDIVVSHQGIEIKTQLIGQLMSALVLPAPEHYRPLLRRLAALSKSAGARPSHLFLKRGSFHSL